MDKDVRPAENIPDLTGNPNDPFDISRRRLLDTPAAEHLSHGISSAGHDLPGPGIPLDL